MSFKFDISIIIINYNTPDLTIDCLDSITKSKLDGLKIEIILVDNASNPATIDQLSTYLKTFPLPHAFIKNPKNLGFGSANNIGIKKARGEYILLLNSDTIVKPDTIIKQFQFAQKNLDYPVSTCKILLPDGNIDPACHRGFPTPWASFTYFAKLEKISPESKLFSQYHQGWKDLAKSHCVDVISGCFFFAKKEIFDQIGLFDRNYFMYGEDIDLCYRLSQKGFKIGFNPNVTITHFKGQSGARTSHHFWQSQKIFYRKHYENKYPKLLTNLIYQILDYKIAHP